MPTPLTNDELDERLKRIFAKHQGKESPIKRWELVVEACGAGSDLPRTDANTYDRMVREGIERLRNHGYLILNLNDGRGRFLCVSENEYWEWREVALKQVRSIAGTVRAMDKAASQKFPNLLQPALFDLDPLTRVLE